MSLLSLFGRNRISQSGFKLIDEKIEVINPLNECIFYLTDKNATVKKGDEVQLGQVVGESTCVDKVSIISTVHGTVKELSEKLTFDGKKAKSIVVSDLKEDEFPQVEIDFDKLNTEEVLNKVKEFSICDEFGNNIAHLLMNSGNKNLILKTSSFEPNFKYLDTLIKLKSREYELGKKIIEKVTGSSFNVCNEKKENVELDVNTIITIGECFITGTVHTYEYISVFGLAVKGNRIIKVKKGTTLREIFEHLQGNENDLYKIVVGGALKGKSVFNLDVAIDRPVKSILFLNEEECRKGKTESCIRCAKCLRTCPLGLNPIKLIELWERKDTDEFIKFGGDKCIECGLCSYNCPSNIEVAHIIKTAKEYKK